MDPEEILADPYQVLRDSDGLRRHLWCVRVCQEIRIAGLRLLLGSLLQNLKSKMTTSGSRGNSHPEHGTRRVVPVWEGSQLSAGSRKDIKQIFNRSHK